MLKSTIKHIQDIFAGLFLKTAKQVYKQTKLTTSSTEKKTWNVFWQSFYQLWKKKISPQAAVLIQGNFSVFENHLQGK